MKREYRQFFQGPVPWPKRGLELPRIEVHLTFHKGDGMYTVEYLVRRIILDKIEAVALNAGCGMGRSEYWARPGELYVTWRIGADARHDAKALKLPLYLTTERGDVTSMNLDDGEQTLIKRAKERR